MTTIVNADLGVTCYSDDEGQLMRMQVYAHARGTFTLAMFSSDGGTHFSVNVTRDQALWLASALVEATAQDEVTNAG